MQYWEKAEEPYYIEQILSSSEKKLEREKELLLSEFIKQDLTQDSYPHFIKLIVANKNVKFYFHQNLDQTSVDFITSYLAPFASDHKDQTAINIYYSTYTNEYADPNHKIWWEKLYYARTQKIADGEYTINHRNFLGLIRDGGENCFFIGPTLSNGCSDTIDNAFLSFVAPSLISVSSLALHAATVIVDNEAYIFYGPSGVGKSTIAEFCNEKYGFQVMSGDQVYINLDNDNDLWAWPSVSTIINFSRSSKDWCGKPTRVKALINLSRGVSDFGFNSKSTNEMISSFMREVVYLPCLGEQDKLLDLVIKTLQAKNITLGKMYYKKNFPFWDKLKEEL